MKLGESPLLRMLAVIVAVAVSIRLVFELIGPILPELAAVVAAIAVWQLGRWHRDRW